MSAYDRKRYRERREYVIAKARRWKLWNRCRITPERVAELKEQQCGRCALCLREVKLLCVDHDHETGRVRGMLCRTCNMGPVRFADADVGFIDRLGNYLLSQKDRRED